VVELVRSLGDEYRLALVWKYLEGCSYEEIGERLSMSFNQVDYLLRKAKTALRDAVERSSMADSIRRGAGKKTADGQTT
jgi:DNA-directed RNA polymerase specialized sigma24 family protein